MAFIGVDAEQTSKSQSAHKLSLSTDPECFRNRARQRESMSVKARKRERERERVCLSFSGCLVLLGC